MAPAFPAGGTFPTLAVVPVATAICLAAALGHPRGAEGEATAGPVPTFDPAGSRSLGRYSDLRRASVRSYALAFHVDEGMAERILETALREGIEPDLAFRLVHVESSFRRHAVGPAGSVGLTQVRPGTARWLDPDVTRETLFEPETNLRLGFRYLRFLLDQHGGDLRLALLAYNRGPGTVAAVLALGQDPGNGYARRVLGDVRSVGGASDTSGFEEACMTVVSDGLR